MEIFKISIKIWYKNFLEEIKYQESAFNYNNEDNIFNILQNEIKNDLINFLNDNLSQFIYEIISNYNKRNYQNEFNGNLIEQIIKYEDIESFYKSIIYESLSRYAKNQTSIKLERISVILTGKSGVGKSTLINCFLKTNAQEGLKDVTTLVTKVYKNEKEYPFLILTDTRGYSFSFLYTSVTRVVTSFNPSGAFVFRKQLIKVDFPTPDFPVSTTDILSNFIAV